MNIHTIKRAMAKAALAAAITAGAATASFAASDIVGFIDAQRVLLAHPKYESTQKHLDDFVQKKTSEARAAAEKAANDEARMEIVRQARIESGEEEIRVMNPIMEAINGAIDKIAKQKGVTVVVTKQMIYYGGVDLTEDVIKSVKALK